MATDEAKKLTTVVTPRLLRRVAGERFFGRGEAYFAEGAVRSLRREGGGVKAVVQGTRRYRVHLWAEDGDLGHDCTCPVGRDGEFCKHCVAVGLAWHAGGQSDDAGVTEDSETAVGEEDLRAYLLGLDQESGRFGAFHVDPPDTLKLRNNPELDPDIVSSCFMVPRAVSFILSPLYHPRVSRVAEMRGNDHAPKKLEIYDRSGHCQDGSG